MCARRAPHRPAVLLAGLALAGCGVDALEGAFEGPTEPIPGVVDKNAASARATQAGGSD